MCSHTGLYGRTTQGCVCEAADQQSRAEADKGVGSFWTQALVNGALIQSQPATLGQTYTPTTLHRPSQRDKTHWRMHRLCLSLSVALPCQIADCSNITTVWEVSISTKSRPQLFPDAVAIFSLSTCLNIHPNLMSQLQSLSVTILSTFPRGITPNL